ncbi:KLTH0H09020p [Lachancea thermotolerans CBS 6340]|uniref:KLTH0H09020p n=1 Tax=Lachancea thermotolerans (strain ATCC 56472 / CBS 6340 / NRRL Y-8284) TaxID=559295 RepID=C5E2Z3_LACTC|nr:KLTH0H09020p [Lachancea thermotolerans CBS 6340]CAR30404.1 KLTH0H09020p [Lachancea thermotolerans CBS 6340]
MVRLTIALGSKCATRHYTVAARPQTGFSLLNLRIGFASQVGAHPNSDKMFVSQIKVSNGGADAFKQVCSGLRGFVTREDLEGSLLVLVDNMKKCKLRGEVSEAMILCGDDSVSGIVQPCKPANFDLTLVGQPVVLEGTPAGAQPTSRRIKNNEWLEVSSRLYVDNKARVVYKDPETQTETPLCVYNEEKAIPILVGSVSPGSPVR